MSMERKFEFPPAEVEASPQPKFVFPPALEEKPWRKRLKQQADGYSAAGDQGNLYACELRSQFTLIKGGKDA